MSGLNPAEFGDAEPEDAWHPDDPLPVLIDNLRRRAELIEAAAAELVAARLAELLAGLEHVTHRARLEIPNGPPDG